MPVTPPKKESTAQKYTDVKEIIETAKRTRKDSFEKIKEIDTVRKSKLESRFMG